MFWIWKTLALYLQFCKWSFFFLNLLWIIKVFDLKASLCSNHITHLSSYSRSAKTHANVRCGQGPEYLCDLCVFTGQALTVEMLTEDIFNPIPLPFLSSVNMIDLEALE